MMKYHKKSGFTLLELLVVISIISLLLSTILVFIQSARTKANNIKYATELNSLRKAIILYRMNKNGLPPCPPANPTFGAPIASQCFDFGGFPWLDDALSVLVSNNYISSIPHYPEGKWWGGGSNWAYTTYRPNVYNTAGVVASETSCTPVNYPDWKIGSLPGVILITTNQKLPLSGGYTQCDSTAMSCSNQPPSNNGFNFYCLSLDL